MIFKCGVVLTTYIGIFYIILGCCQPLAAQDASTQDFRYHYRQGVTAFEEKNHQQALNHFRTADQLRPGHQIILFQLARAYGYNLKNDSAAACLQRALATKVDFDLSDSAFLDMPQLPNLLSLQKSLMSPVNNSSTVLSIKERDLHLESLAYHPKSDRLFLGSVRKQKILWVNLKEGSDAPIHEFKSTDNLWSVFGMKVHGSHLWVCTVNTPYMQNQDTLRLQQSAILKFDLESDQLIKRYDLPEDQKPHWFGDLTVAPDGTVYISDSQANTVYRISPHKDHLEPFFSDDRFLSLQGLDLDPEQGHLYLADYVTGPYVLELKTKTLYPVTCNNPQVSLKAIDGLYFYQGNLIVTQNQVVPMRVSRLKLDTTNKTVASVTYLEKANPWLNEPTLGVIIGKEFYYVANSQWGGYDQAHQPKPWDQLQDIKIFKLAL